MLLWVWRRMFVQILYFSFKYFVADGHYFPGQFFSQQSQSQSSLFQGAASSQSFGGTFGGFPLGFGPVPIVAPGIHASSHGIHGGWSPPSSSSSASSSSSPSFPSSPINVNVGFGKPSPSAMTMSNELKPSITGWDTTYSVPCGTYKIHPFVNAHIRYSSIRSPPPGYSQGINFDNIHGRSIPDSPPRPNSRQDRSFYPPLFNFNGFRGDDGPTTCSWNFQSIGACKLKFTCSWFQLPALFQCDENVMELTDVDQFTYKFCGNRKPRGTYVSTSESIKLTFKSHSYALPSIFDCSVSCSLESFYDVPGKDKTTTKPNSASHFDSDSGSDSGSSNSDFGSGNHIHTHVQSEMVPQPPTILKYGDCRCGVRGSSTRIVGGRMTQPGEYPWTLALVKRNSNRPFCGGVLINNEWALSAAHCVQNRRQGRDDGLYEFEVLLNGHDISKIKETNGGTMRAKVNKIIIHPQYDNFTYNFDIALLRFDKAIAYPQKKDDSCKNQTQNSREERNHDYPGRMENKFESQFVPICLVHKSKAYTAFDDFEGIVTGWGLTKEGGIPSNSMMQATVKIFNDSFCQEFYRAKDVVTKQMICAGHFEGKLDSCVGDSGGPLIVPEEGKHYTLAGLVSWGRGCGRPNLPGVYTRLTGLTEWIHSHTADAVWCEP